MGRYIGIRHRVKQTAEGEARPTMVAIREGDTLVTHELGDETAELDFVLGTFPTSFRKLKKGEETRKFLPRHVKCEERDDGTIRVPAGFDGFQPGDTVAMALGGSGDRLAFALSRRAEEIGGAVLRIPPFVLKDHRNGGSKDDDHLTLSALVKARPELFYPTTLRDRALIRVSEAFRARQDALKARMACGQRLRQQVIGRIFLSEAGGYPEGRIEAEYDRLEASDVIFAALSEEEKRREAELRKAVRALDIWSELFEPIEGMGEVLAGRIISAILDIRRFETDAKLKAFCGVHVLPDGRFARKRLGAVANWNPEARQALYLLGEQFNRRPDSVWGQKLREYKKKFRATHPEVTEVKGKKRYTQAHIHKMGIWRTLTKFVERLHSEWTKLEARERLKSAPRRLEKTA